MRRRNSCALLALLCSLACSASLTAAESLGRCDGPRSALVRSVINKYIMPHVKWSGHELDKACPFHPDRDMGAEHDAKGFGKDVCLADLCEPLMCDRLAIPASEEERKALKELPHDDVCNAEETADLRAKCKKIAELCSTSEDKKFSRWMWDVVYGHICRAHSCHPDWRDSVLAGLTQSKAHVHWFYKIMAGYVTGGLVVIYILVWAYFRFFVGLTDERDLIPKGRRGGQGEGRKAFEWWPFGKPKDT